MRDVRFDASRQELVYNSTSWRHSWRGAEEFPQLKDDRQDLDIQSGVKTVIADGFAHVAPYFQFVPPPFQYLMEVGAFLQFSFLQGTSCYRQMNHIGGHRRADRPARACLLQI